MITLAVGGSGAKIRICGKPGCKPGTGKADLHCHQSPEEERGIEN